MGAKGLKAIAVRGTGNVKIARPEEFRKAVKDARNRALSADKARKMPGGPPEARLSALQKGFLPGKNFQTGVLPGWTETRGMEVAKKYFTKREGTCWACPTSCFNLVEVKEGKFAGTKVIRGLMPWVVFEWGGKCALDNLAAIWRC